MPRLGLPTRPSWQSTIRPGPSSGWVGSRDFADESHSGQIDGALIKRQSASALKPFLYARALEKSWTPATLLPDSPIEFGSPADETYRPVNFDRRSHGVVRLRTALASSLNVPAVFTLSRVGVPDFIQELRSLGFSLPADAQSRWGLGMAIGNAEVSLLELTRAFSVFPNGGILAGLALTAAGPRTASRIFDPSTAWLICNILSDPSARVTGFGTRTYFRTPFPAMFKSGTSSEFTNLWCLGATPRYTVGVWAGNFDGRAVVNKTGSIVPTQLVVDVLTRLTTGPEEFRMPPGIVAAKIDTLTGQGATPSCPSVRTEYFRGEAEVPGPCTYHSSASSRETLLLESLLGKGDMLRILFPVDGQVFYLDPTLSASQQSIPLVVAARGGRRISLTVDGMKIAGESQDPQVSLPAGQGRARDHRQDLRCRGQGCLRGEVMGRIGSMDDADFFSIQGNHVILRVKAKPGARQDSVGGVRAAELLVSVRVPAEKGRANAEIVRLLAKSLGIARDEVVLKLGGSSSHKVFELPLSAAAALARIRAGW